ncbi:MAG: DUF1802 family protein [Thermoanaerobaculia bacterium]
MNKLPHHTALKEWSNVIAALGDGVQVVLIRKGGIADPAFGVEAERFYLYPTFFHQGESEHRPSVTVTHWCEVVKTWKVNDLELLTGLEKHVVMPRETLNARYRFRPDQAVFVIAVRAWELAQPVEVHFEDAYAGCRSWISLENEIDVEGSRRVLGEAELLARIEEVDAVLSAAPVP